MQDKIRRPTDLGLAIRQARQAGKLRTTDIARRSGRSHDVLHRLEKGDDVTVASLLNILRAMGLCLRLESAGLPTLEERQQRFSDLDGDLKAGR